MLCRVDQGNEAFQMQQQTEKTGRITHHTEPQKDKKVKDSYSFIGSEGGESMIDWWMKPSSSKMKSKKTLMWPYINKELRWKLK